MKKKIYIKKFITPILLLITATQIPTGVISSCASDCKTCTKGKCIECELGFGLNEAECILCNRTNCLNCDGNEEDCVKCAPYHFREPIEGGKYHECTKCGFGCQDCVNKEKCVTCGSMFIHSVVDNSNCIVNHAKLFIILVLIMASLCVSSCIAFWCTPGIGEVSIKAQIIKRLEEELKRKESELTRYRLQFPEVEGQGDTARNQLITEGDQEPRTVELKTDDKAKDEEKKSENDSSDGSGESEDDDSDHSNSSDSDKQSNSSHDSKKKNSKA